MWTAHTPPSSWYYSIFSAFCSDSVNKFKCFSQSPMCTAHPPPPEYTHGPTRFSLSFVPVSLPLSIPTTRNNPPPPSCTHMRVRDRRATQPGSAGLSVRCPPRCHCEKQHKYRGHCSQLPRNVCWGGMVRPPGIPAALTSSRPATTGRLSRIAFLAVLLAVLKLRRFSEHERG